MAAATDPAGSLARSSDVGEYSAREARGWDTAAMSTWRERLQPRESERTSSASGSAQDFMETSGGRTFQVDVLADLDTAGGSICLRNRRNAVSPELAEKREMRKQRVAPLRTRIGIRVLRSP